MHMWYTIDVFAFFSQQNKILNVGIILGFALRPYKMSYRDVKFFSFPGELLMRMLQMLVLPLLVSSLVTGNFFLWLICLYVFVLLFCVFLNQVWTCKWTAIMSILLLYFSWTAAYAVPGNVEKIKTQFQNSHYRSKYVLLQSILRSNALLKSSALHTDNSSSSLCDFFPLFYHPTVKIRRDAHTNSTELLSLDSVLNCSGVYCLYWLSA